MYGPGFRSYFESALLSALYECFGIVGCLLQPFSDIVLCCQLGRGRGNTGIP